jgi:hypothetical protein
VVEAPGIESWGSGTEGDPTGANGGIGDRDIVPDALVGGGSRPPEDDSGTIPSPSREALIVALRNATGDPTVVDDLALARDVAALLAHVLGRWKSTDDR